MSANLITEEEKDTLLAQRQQTIEALLQYIASILNERGADEAAGRLTRFYDYVKDGGELKIKKVKTSQAQRARELMDFFKVDHYQLADETGESGDYCTYLFREDQAESMDKVAEYLEFENNTHLVWIEVDDFLRLNVGNTLCRVTIAREQVSSLTQVLDDTGLMFSVNFLVDERADVYFHEYDKEQMKDCIGHVYGLLGIDKDISIERINIDSAYTAQRLADDKERNEHSHQKSHSHHAFNSLSL